MEGKLFKDCFSEQAKLLIVVASHFEFDALVGRLAPGAKVERERFASLSQETYTLLQSGVGKSNAAAAVSHYLTRFPGRYGGVLSFGIAGSYHESLGLYQVIQAKDVIFADEGRVEGADPGFVSLQEAGWADCHFACAETDWTEALEPYADRRGRIATVSTISNRDELALTYSARTLADAEGMEGAAVAQVCTIFGVDMCELRVISNICGDRKHKPWDIPGALKKAADLFMQWELR